MWWFAAAEAASSISAGSAGSVGASTEWALIVGALVAFGIVLLALEILVIPGFGVVGIAGVLAMLAAGVLAWRTLGPMGGVITFAAGVAAGAFLLWLFPRTRLARKLALSENQKGFRAPPSGLERLVGVIGVAETTLRPAGQATLQGERVDVVTDGVFVEAGASVRVVEVEGGRVVVEPLEN